MSGWLASVLVCTASLAAAPVDRPVAPLTPATPQERPPLMDPHRPAFVPAFAKVDNPPVGRTAEREYAYRYTYPGPVLYGYGGYGWAFGYRGFGYGGYASTIGQSR